MMKRFALPLVAVMAAALLVGVLAPAGAVVVYPGDLQGWVYASRQGTSTLAPTAQFVNGPGAPPAGSGSFQMRTGYSDTDPLSKVYLGTNNHSGVPLANITSFKYYTFTTNRDYPNGQPPMIELITDSGTSAQQRRFWFYPWGANGNQNVQLNVWQEWDLMSASGRWELVGTSSTNYFGNWSWVVGRYPGAKLATPYVGDYLDPLVNLQLANQTGTSLSVKIGAGKAQDSRYGAWWQTSSSINGFVDLLVIGIDGVEYVYDFEVVPEPASLTALALGLGAFGGLVRRHRK
jgi:hypothetical protein